MQFDLQHVLSFRLVAPIFASIFLFICSPLQANPEIYGGAANSGPTGIGAVLANPARAIELGGITAGIYLTPNQTSTDIRLPGSEPTSDSKTNLFALPEGAVVYRLNKKFALIFGVPIPGLSAKIQSNGVPIPVFGQTPTVNLEAEGTLIRIEAGAAMRLSDKVALGLLVKYQNTAFDVLVKDDSDQDVIDFTGSAGLVQVKLGGRLSISPKLKVYAATTVFDSSSQQFDFDLQLGSNAAADTSPQTDAAEPTIFKDATLGAQMKLKKGISVFLEAAYEAAIAAPRFSLTDLAEQEVDSGPVVAVRGGASMKLSPSLALLGGGAFHPSGVGPGKAGEAPTGYGIFDFSIPALTGEKVKPFWQAGAGVALKFGKKTRYLRQKSGRKRSRTIKRSTYRGEVSIGAALRKTSVGLDNDAEQPAAYEKTDILIPIGVRWKF